MEGDGILLRGVFQGSRVRFGGIFFFFLGARDQLRTRNRAADERTEHDAEEQKGTK